jgi:hypothetical protein
MAALDEQEEEERASPEDRVDGEWCSEKRIGANLFPCD